MYMRFKPERAMARSWYSRFALSTAKAFTTKFDGKVFCTNKNRCSTISPTLELDIGTKTLMRGLLFLLLDTSSKPSTQASDFSARAVRNWLALGWSGLS